MFDTWPEHRLGGQQTTTYPSTHPNSVHIQVTVEASLLSLICVVIIFILIGVRSVLLHVVVQV
jgi:hypothetical protein